MVLIIFSAFAALMLLIALFTKIFPAKKVNSWYGYRTDRSMRNRRNWRYAQSLLPPMFFRIGLVYIALAAFWYFYPNLNEKLGLIVFIFVLISGFGIEIYSSERKLKRFSKERHT